VPAAPSPDATIVAPATGPAPGGVGVLRLSGPLALALGKAVVRGLPGRVAPRQACFVRFVDRTQAVLDEGLFIYFRAPRSFTGEDVVELHTHGSPALLSLLQAEILKDGRARLAEPGEFTRRAFVNGRMDLARAEAVADLIAASSEAAVRAAAAQLSGAMSERARAVREPLGLLHAELEGELNFPDEAEPTPDVSARLAEAREQLLAWEEGARRAAVLRRGARVVLFGPVNAGKSSLFNALLGEARALVDEEPGTTRDVLEARWDVDGIPATLVDTAGLRTNAARVEALGVEKARAAVRAADLGVLVLPAGTPAEEADAWAAQAAGRPVLRVASKADLFLGAAGAWPVSAKTGAGVTALTGAIARALQAGAVASAVAGAADRHLDALGRSREALERAQAAVQVGTVEIVAGEVGLAMSALLEITGENVGDALLDGIFKRFCIGK